MKPVITIKISHVSFIMQSAYLNQGHG